MNRSTRTTALLTSLALLIFVAGCNTAPWLGTPIDVADLGVHVSVTGRVEQGITFGGRGFGVALRETQGRHGR